MDQNIHLQMLILINILHKEVHLYFSCIPKNENYTFMWQKFNPKHTQKNLIEISRKIFSNYLWKLSSVASECSKMILSFSTFENFFLELLFFFFFFGQTVVKKICATSHLKDETVLIFFFANVHPSRKSIWPYVCG